MKKWLLDIDVSFPFLYEVEVIRCRKLDCDIEYIKKVFDFFTASMNKKSTWSIIGTTDTVDIKALYDSYEIAINTLVNDEYGIHRNTLIKKIFENGGV